MQRSRVVLLALLVPALLCLSPAPSRGEDGADARNDRVPGRYALLVGCTEYPALRAYLGEDTYRRDIVLYGPENDVALWSDVLVRYLDFAPGDIVSLAGWPEEASKRPTRANILGHLEALAGRVEKDDYVVVLMAGHGTQLPDASGDERDSLDEAFLPADVARWDDDGSDVPGAIYDDEIRTKLGAIRDAGARVCLVMDCCHSGTMVRGGPAGFRSRQVSPDLLGVPRAVTRGVPTRPKEADGVGDGLVALYAAQSYHRAPEMSLPRRSPDARPHGLLSFLLARQVARFGGGATFDELYRQVAAAYRALPYRGTTPLAEGDLTLRADGRPATSAASAPVIRASAKGDQVELDGGRLAGLVPGAVLEVLDPKGGGVLGFVEVEEAELGRASATRVERDGLTLPALTGDLRLCPTRLVDRPVGQSVLAFAVVDGEGRPIGLAGLPPAARAALGTSVLADRLRLVDDPAEAVWLAVVEGSSITLRPAGLGGGRDGVFRTSAEALAGALARVYRVENLKALAREELVAAPPTGLLVEVRRVKDEEDEGVPLGEGETLRPGDAIRVVVQNRSGRLYDVWVFYADAAYGLTTLFPPRHATARLTPEDTRPWKSDVQDVYDTTLGAEDLVVVAVPQREGAPPLNLGWLAQDPLQQAETPRKMRGGATADLEELLEGLAFGPAQSEREAPRMRGLRGRRGGPKPSLRLIPLRMAWGNVSSLKAFDESPTPVVATRHLHRGDRPPAPASWTPATDPTRYRGSLGETYAKLAPAVFVIRTNTGHGTGFLIDASGLVLTNEHVVAAGYGYSKTGLPSVYLHRGRLGDDGVMQLEPRPVVAEILMTDATQDLALLKIRDSAPWLSDLRPVPLAENGPRPAGRCVMVGHPASAMLWSVRECHVSGVGRAPHDLSDILVRGLAAEGKHAALIESQLARETPVKIALSSCQANPGDSGGPLVNEQGELIAVTHAIPADMRTDKFVYHIHLDEVREFLARKPDPKKPLKPRAPEPWRIGPNVRLHKTGHSAGGRYDVLVAGTERPEQIFIDVDGDAEVPREVPPPVAAIEAIVGARAFEAEIAFHFLADRRIAFYDADNDGTFDDVLVDYDPDPEADIRFRLRDGAWTVEPDVDLPWLGTGYLTWIDDLADEDEQYRLRGLATQKIRALTR